MLFNDSIMVQLICSQDPQSRQQDLKEESIFCFTLSSELQGLAVAHCWRRPGDWSLLSENLSTGCGSSSDVLKSLTLCLGSERKAATIYPEKTVIQKESCTTVFVAALSTIARIWKQPKCPSTDEWRKKMGHIYTMEYYSAIQRNETELYVVRWMDLESVIQSEGSQKMKNKYRMLTHIYGV